MFRFVDKSFLEFFAGIGLMRIGLERAGWSIRYANDIDPAKLEMYQHHFQDANGHFVLGDIHKISAASLPPASLATASFPCNDLSLAGGRAGLIGSHSSAFWGFTALLDQLGQRRPPLVLLENVIGFLTSNHGGDFLAVLLELNRLGYSVDVFIVDAAWFVPQSRQRLFVVGTRNPDAADSKSDESKAFYESLVRPAALAEFIFSHPEVDWRIRDLPPIQPASPRLETVLEEVPSDSSEWWNRDRVDYLLNQMSPRHRRIADDMIEADRQSYGTVFRRVRNGKSMAELRTDGVAGCLRTPRGGSGRQILFKAGQGRAHVRLVNGRECARLMGANDFRLNVPLNQALFGFGDAVCVPVIQWIAENYLNPALNEISDSLMLTEKIA